MANKYAEFCGWCEAYISEDDLEKKYYKTMVKSKSTLGMLQPDNFFKVCLKCLGKFAYIRTLKEHK